MRRRVSLSLLCGIAPTLFLFALSSLVMYKDKPRASNAFTWLLLPGLLVGEQLDGHRFLALAVTLSINALIYAIAIFCLLSTISAVARATDRGG